MNKLPLRQAAKAISDRLTTLYAPPEATQIARMVLCHHESISLTELLLDTERTVDVDLLEPQIEQLAQGTPVQYVLGSAEFCDLQFEVNPSVLIPRPETEELVAWVASEATAGSRILDLCTGSGCIAIALEKAIREAHVTAVDISAEALHTAGRNAERLASEVTFHQFDILQGLDPLGDSTFDIIVSNPPYIPQRDIDSIRLNVKGFEPHIALFVDDSDPLLFYRSITAAAKQRLNCGGKLYFEIYEDFADQMSRLLSDYGYAQITVKQDINNKNRMICATKA